MADPTPEEIAKGLTKAQRVELGRSALSGDSIVTARNMIRKGLFAVVPDSPDGCCGPAKITPFGLAVRFILEQERQL